jgi:hypothetical protein
MSSTSISAPAVDGLTRSFTGRLLQQGDDGYDEARRV